MVGPTFILLSLFLQFAMSPFYTILSLYFFWDGRVSLSEIGFFNVLVLFHVMLHPPTSSTMSSLLTFFFFLAHMSIRLCYIVIDIAIFSSIFLCLLSSPRPATAFSFPFFSLSLSSFLLYFKLRLVLYPAVFIITPSSVGPLQLRIAHM